MIFGSHEWNPFKNWKCKPMLKDVDIANRRRTKRMVLRSPPSLGVRREGNKKIR